MFEATCCRPNDRRGFLHKKVLRLGASLLPGPGGAVARTLLGLGGSGGNGGQAARARPGFRSRTRLPTGSRVQFQRPVSLAESRDFYPGAAPVLPRCPKGLFPKVREASQDCFPGSRGESRDLRQTVGMGPRPRYALTNPGSAPRAVFTSTSRRTFSGTVPSCLVGPNSFGIGGLTTQTAGRRVRRSPV